MKNMFISIVQKCICVDFLLNALLRSNSYNYFTLLSTIKEENLRNIKIICYLYEYLFKDVLVLDNISSIKIDKLHENRFNSLLELYLKIISELNTIYNYNFNFFYRQIVRSLTNSYFNLVSSIHYLCYTQPSDNHYRNKFSFFKPDENYGIGKKSNELTVDEMRNIAAICINIFFDYSLSDEDIYNGGYEVFFENDTENKFYQFFFKCNDIFFKVRILSKDYTVFYMYQSLDNPLEISPSITKDDAKVFADSYLKEKLKDDFNKLIFDKDYLNIYSYMNIPESYKFKYNFKDENAKTNFNKGIYISIDAKNFFVQEISLL
ncbi:hypothetical protein CHF27_005130 [Romboutsia maritimum]|uniref:Uncharacterized protein n=1 Tax=Romboutsia maritimum TaxID=2020948 RepID=A0A371IU00_9FIRM|nr:hypothetical protein [Romboutsia maritimum]RDY23967.1 hypothetical protein CHF27_005130 [Romboutsia maritimum]